MKPRHRLDDDPDDNYEKPSEDKPERDSAGRIKSPSSTSGRPPPDFLRRDDDALITVIRPDGSHGLMARDDPRGFRFVQFNIAEKVRRTLKPNNNKRIPKKRP